MMYCDTRECINKSEIYSSLFIKFSLRMYFNVYLNVYYTTNYNKNKNTDTLMWLQWTPVKDVIQDCEIYMEYVYVKTVLSVIRNLNRK